MQGQTVQVTLSIGGMGCGGCAAKIEKLLGRTDGVHTAAVSFPRGEAVVDYDPAATDRSRLISLLTEAGYTVQPSEPSGASHG